MMLLLPGERSVTALTWAHASYQDECPRCGGTTVGYSDGYQLSDRRLCIWCEPQYEYDRIEIRCVVIVWPTLEQARADMAEPPGVLPCDALYPGRSGTDAY